MELTKRQRNDIFEALQVEGIDPADCELSDSQPAPGNESRIEISHLPTNSWFRFFLAPARFSSIWLVYDGPFSGSPPKACKDWTDVLEQLRYWAKEVQYVDVTPDLWTELQQVPAILATAQSEDASNEPFTPDEQAEIARRLDEVKQLVREQFELTSEQLAVIDQRLDEVREESKHQGRKTWLYTFYGAVMSTVMTDEIPPHVIQTIVTTVVSGIGHLFGIAGPPPILGP